MHCDVTGFTAMSEALAQSGNEGAEFMAGILNRFFDRMLGIAGAWNGIQMKFGGDAMLLYFAGSDHACKAAACGLEMQKAMVEYQLAIEWAKIQALTGQQVNVLQEQSNETAQ